MYILFYRRIFNIIDIGKGKRNSLKTVPDPDFFQNSPDPDE